MRVTKPKLDVLDPVTVQVIRNSFVAAADEMKITMVKTAYNDLLIEVQDFGCIITDANGNMMAQSDTMPVFLSVLPGCIEVGLERFGAQGFDEGDVILANDPYTTGTHISDTAIYIPIFVAGELVGFVGCMAHWADIGGKSPGGWCSDSTDVYQEGLRFDHLKIVEAGQPNETLLSMIWGNVRLPLITMGDFGAQLAACKTGAARVQTIYERYGADTVAAATEEIFRQSEVAMRASIRAIPNGSYSAESYLDHDGVERTSEVRVKVTVRVEDDRFEADFTGSSASTRGPVNCPLPAVIAGVESALKALTLPYDRINAGYRRPLSVIAPPGTVVNPQFPSPVDSYGFVYQLAADLVIRALAAAMPERCAAGSYPLFLIYFFRVMQPGASEARTLSEGAFVFVDPAVGGSGASQAADGANGLICLLDGDAPCPVAEMVEARYPLRLERYELNPKSCGAGQFRGGMGATKQYRILEDGLFSEISIEGTHYPAWGLFDGGNAQPSRVTLWPGTEKERIISDKIGNVGPFAAGDIVLVDVGGGGGWGDPLERHPDVVLQDVLDDFLTVDDARDLYGVEVDPDSLTVDTAATATLRTHRLQSRPK